jgi:hypothetical protein
MTAKLSSHIPVIFCMGFACMGFAAALFGQIDSNQLRARYGAPLARETFTVSPGFQIIADYGPDQKVCRLELPAGGNQQRVDDVLLELVPMSMRGKNLGTLFDYASRASIKITDYENISIGEPQDPDRPGRRTGLNVVFKREACRGL